MIYTTRELLDSGETEYSIRKRVDEGSLFLIEKGLYDTDSNAPIVDEVYISKKYKTAIITGLSAFYLYDLTDNIPDFIYVATEQHSFPIRRKEVKQSYQDESFFLVGLTTKEISNGVIKTYDLERLLIELIRLKEKYPKELYYEVLNSFRKIKEQIDFYKVNNYLKHFSNGERLLQKIKEII